METKLPQIPLGQRDSFVVCRNSQGTEVRGTLLRLTRYLVVFEVYNPYSILQLSEVLSDFKIIINDRLGYSGRAVVSNLVNTGIVLICETTLDDSWLDVDLFAPISQRAELQAEFAEFLREWEKVYRVLPEFKVVVADMQMLLMDLRRWFEQLEFGVRSHSAGDRALREREVIEQLRELVMPAINALFNRFESIAGGISEDLQPVHRSYIKRQIHPLVLCSPFAFRIYQKPLGYAGDYEMVNMILRDPHEGGSLFAKMLNTWLLGQVPGQAHRNRIDYLTECLAAETRRMVGQGRNARIFNLGCGPAQEVQNFVSHSDLCERAHLTLLDFNDETLLYTGKVLEGLKSGYGRRTPIEVIKKSVHQILKEGARAAESGADAKYDFLYCAGLFDYLSDRICRRLMNIFYDMLAPGGLLVATNVDVSNPIRNLMEYLLEWHLVYRDRNGVLAVAPERARPEQLCLRTDSTGVNIYLEVRKPAA